MSFALHIYLVYPRFAFNFLFDVNVFAQIAFYFGYMLLFCFALFFICGAIGVWGATVFVHKIYRNVKID